jgi:hypothetical protein
MSGGARAARSEVERSFLFASSLDQQAARQAVLALALDW